MGRANAGVCWALVAAAVIAGCGGDSRGAVETAEAMPSAPAPHASSEARSRIEALRQARYREALDGADVVHRAGPDGTEDLVVFERPFWRRRRPGGPGRGCGCRAAGEVEDGALGALGVAGLLAAAARRRRGRGRSALRRASRAP
jgi:MYXO-CTERM domain-containing protein